MVRRVPPQPAYRSRPMAGSADVIAPNGSYVRSSRVAEDAELVPDRPAAVRPRTTVVVPVQYGGAHRLVEPGPTAAAASTDWHLFMSSHRSKFSSPAPAAWPGPTRQRELRVPVYARCRRTLTRLDGCRTRPRRTSGTARRPVAAWLTGGVGPPGRTGTRTSPPSRGSTFRVTFPSSSYSSSRAGRTVIGCPSAVSYTVARAGAVPVAS